MNNYSFFSYFVDPLELWSRMTNLKTLDLSHLGILYGEPSTICNENIKLLTNLQSLSLGSMTNFITFDALKLNIDYFHAHRFEEKFGKDLQIIDHLKELEVLIWKLALYPTF